MSPIYAQTSEHLLTWHNCLVSDHFHKKCSTTTNHKTLRIMTQFVRITNL